MKVLLKLEIEGLPPTVNHLYRNSGHIRYKTAQGRKYQERVSGLLREAWGDRPVLMCPIEFRITFLTPDNRRWDIDNRVKALQDCLSEGGVIKDDRQIEILHVERKKSVKTGTKVEVCGIGGKRRT